MKKCFEKLERRLKEEDMNSLRSLKRVKKFLEEIEPKKLNYCKH